MDNTKNENHFNGIDGDDVPDDDYDGGSDDDDDDCHNFHFFSLYHFMIIDLVIFSWLSNVISAIVLIFG